MHLDSSESKNNFAGQISILFFVNYTFLVTDHSILTYSQGFVMMGLCFIINAGLSPVPPNDCSAMTVVCLCYSMGIAIVLAIQKHIPVRAGTVSVIVSAGSAYRNNM